MGLSMLTLVVLMTVALPPLLKVFKQLDTDIPAMTQIALTGVSWVQGNFLTAVVGTASFFFIFTLLRRVPTVRYWMDAVQTRLPLIGSFTIMGEIASFSRTTSLLLNAGVTLSPALQQGIKGTKNLHIKKALMDSDQRLHSGQPFGEALKLHKILPMMFVQFVVIGEETNSLAKTLRDAGEDYQRQLEQKLDSFLGMLEPASTVLVGGIVGFIAFSMFVPIYSGMKALG
ncbi:MAG: Type II secretory pathway, component PulF [Chloroflexi bacterium]|jgi:type II secretory pathway component PulF|nr:MAG: Type II secretory pathway, component PulF [Chloroflexota bacterium]